MIAPSGRCFWTRPQEAALPCMQEIRIVTIVTVLQATATFRRSGGEFRGRLARADSRAPFEQEKQTPRTGAAFDLVEVARCASAELKWGLVPDDSPRKQSL